MKQHTSDPGGRPQLVREDVSRHAPRLLVLLLLLGINAVNFFDRQVLSAVAEPIRKEWALSDTDLGWLGTAFTLLYAAIGIPLGRAADLWNRRWILTAGLSLWSGLTYVSGLCRGFWSLFAARLGVGVGEAACAPAATSVIGDLFRPAERGRAMSVFMVGLPIGIALGYVVSGTIAGHFGWRAAFFVAGIPGLVLAGISLLMCEPRRGLSEAATLGTERRSGSPYLIVLTIPTMWWIIASGAVHNFAMYALSSFLPAFLVRYHHASVQTAGFVSGIVIGSLGAAGMLLGGWLGDIIFRRRPDGRMLAAGVAALISVPAGLLALNVPQGALAAFTVLQGTACLFLYVYYATVYASIHDVVEPSLRGTAMAMSFFAMYLLGASLGPLGAGWLSDFLARAAARNAHALVAGANIPEQFRAIGLHQAMHVVPLTGIVLAAVLFAGSVTVRRDIERLRTWMNQTAAKTDRITGSR